MPTRKPQTKQIEAYWQGDIFVGPFSANGADDDVSSAIGTALSTAGNGGVSVPAQPASPTQIGVITTNGGVFEFTNRVEIWEAGTEEKLTDPVTGKEIYGRLTEAGGTYTLTYFFLDGGTETAFSFASATNIDFNFGYRFDFHRRPEALTRSANAKFIGQDPPGGGSGKFEEAIAVTATNTLAALTKTPSDTNVVFLIVNTLEYSTLKTDFSVVGTAITWAGNFDLEIADDVIARYATNG